MVPLWTELNPRRSMPELPIPCAYETPPLHFSHLPRGRHPCTRICANQALLQTSIGVFIIVYSLTFVFPQTVPILFTQMASESSYCRYMYCQLGFHIGIYSRVHNSHSETKKRSAIAKNPPYKMFTFTDICHLTFEPSRYFSLHLHFKSMKSKDVNTKMNNGYI